MQNEVQKQEEARQMSGGYNCENSFEIGTQNIGQSRATSGFDNFVVISQDIVRYPEIEGPRSNAGH